MEARLIGPGKGFRTPGLNEYEKAQHRALMRIARIERKRARDGGALVRI